MTKNCSVKTARHITASNFRGIFVPRSADGLTPIKRQGAKSAEKYSLEIDSAAFEDIYGLTTNPIKQGLKVKSKDDYSTLLVNLS
ncbi:MAG: hypothetical protein II583_02085, partial [Oscillospiraceae bacterium]|nr:hypothetical protein [Oscillospiraceae bacterium]